MSSLDTSQFVPEENSEAAVQPSETQASFAVMPDALFTGGGELGARMRAMDWSSTHLGPVEDWPQSLRTCVRIILTSRQPMFIWWGDNLINLYNDAYKAIVGGKHPQALGEPASVVWHEIWDQVGPRAETAIRSDEGTYDESLQLIMERYGYPEETYYTFSYSPVPNDRGGTGGILCANTDDTQRIIGERRVALLRELASRTSDARTWQEACRRSTAGLGSNSHDICFALLYVLNESRTALELASSLRLDKGHPAAPEILPLDSSAVWPAERAIQSHEIQVVKRLDRFFEDLPGGAWPVSPRTAAVVPLSPSGTTGRAGLLVIGLNPYRLVNDDYLGFLKLIAGQISASIANAEAYDQERQRAEDLARLDRAKTIFFSNISHEFRTPLTLMLGPLEDLLDGQGASLSPAVREEVETVHRSGLRLLKLVNTLLDFSRIEAGRIQATYRPVNLARHTAELASVFRSAMEREPGSPIASTAKRCGNLYSWTWRCGRRSCSIFSPMPSSSPCREAWSLPCPQLTVAQGFPSLTPAQAFPIRSCRAFLSVFTGLKAPPAAPMRGRESASPWWMNWCACTAEACA